MKLAYAALPLFVLDGAAPAADPARYMTAELIAASATPAPGSSSILVGIRMTPRPGWHGYWSNPGDSGIAPTVRWSAPKGVTFGPLLHPAPTLLTADGMSSFVHGGRHVLLSRLRIARSVAPGTAIPITAALSWAACTATQCVPLHATLSLQLAAGNGERPGLAGIERCRRKAAAAGGRRDIRRRRKVAAPVHARAEDRSIGRPFLPRRARCFPAGRRSGRTDWWWRSNHWTRVGRGAPLDFRSVERRKQCLPPELHAEAASSAPFCGRSPRES